MRRVQAYHICVFCMATNVAEFNYSREYTEKNVRFNSNYPPYLIDFYLPLLYNILYKERS